MALIACRSCGRHIREEDRCPFCNAPRAGALAALALVGAAGCGGSKKPADTKPGPGTTAPAPADAGAATPTPTPDATTATTTPPPDPGQGVAKPLYGVIRK